MRDNEQPHLFAKLVLCTSRTIAYYSEDGEYDPDRPDSARIHQHLVTHFSRAFGALVLELELLGFEVIPEFYVDTLYTDYELSVGGRDEDRVGELVEEFQSTAEAILADLPQVLDFSV